MEGRKDDSGKPRYDLLPFTEIEDIVRVLTYGAGKYEDNNWQKVGKERHFAAMLRHIAAWRMGSDLDLESGLPHLAHAATCLLFVMWHERGHRVDKALTKVWSDKRRKIAIDETWRKTIEDINKGIGGTLIRQDREGLE